MRALSKHELPSVYGGTNPPPPTTIAPNQQITVKAGPFEYTGPANTFAAGWEGFKAQLAGAGWTAAQAITLIEAGIACDFYSDWNVCMDAQGQVDFVMQQGHAARGPNEGGGSGGGGGGVGGGGGIGIGGSVGGTVIVGHPKKVQ